MRILISIDDTDNIESRGTGKVAELLSTGIASKGLGTCGPVTRHQLFVHPDIPYTSHNSSMCFPAEISENSFNAVTDYCRSALAAESAPGSDPGLCVLALGLLKEPKTLMDYGRRAKATILSKKEAYETAANLGIHLSEHGGSGQGVIGALAAAGLRLTGNDGRFKGKLRIPAPNGTASVKEIRNFGVGLVKTADGQALDDPETIHVGEWIKLVLLDDKPVLIVVPANHGSECAWKASDKTIFRRY